MAATVSELQRANKAWCLHAVFCLLLQQLVIYIPPKTEIKSNVSDKPISSTAVYDQVLHWHNPSTWKYQSIGLWSNNVVGFPAYTCSCLRDGSCLQIWCVECIIAVQRSLSITEQHFEDPWMSLSLRYSRDSTSGDLSKEETAGVQLITTTLFPTAAFNSLIGPSTPPFCFSSPIPKTLIGHSELKQEVVELTGCLWGGWATFGSFIRERMWGL